MFLQKVTQTIKYDRIFSKLVLDTVRVWWCCGDRSADQNGKQKYDYIPLVTLTEVTSAASVGMKVSVQNVELLQSM